MSSVFQTIVAGLTVLAIGHLLSKLVIEPIQELWKVTGRVADALIFSANIYKNPGTGEREELVAAQENLRRQASALLGAKNAIPLYEVWGWIRLVPKRQDLLSAHSNLIGLSNSVFKPAHIEHNEKRVNHIATNLRLDIGEL